MKDGPSKTESCRKKSPLKRTSQNTTFDNSSDLIDVRCELAEHLRAIGMTPVLSDDKLSDFKVAPDANSIKTCLINVDSCEHFILILDQRYGRTLEGAGFPPLSATHLEYRRAREKERAIRVYVRDRLEADYSAWKDNRDFDELKLSWVRSKHDYGLFELLKEHRTLRADSAQSNWFDTFTSSVDLKAALSKAYQATLLPQHVMDAIKANAFPIFRATVDIEHKPGRTEDQFCCRTELTNVGGAPAFDGLGTQLRRTGDTALCRGMIAAGC